MPLEVKGGGVKIVEVDKVVIVKVPQTLVTSFPFTINAPPGAGLYFWGYPAGVQAVDKNDKLEITSAPKGMLSVSVKAIGAKLDKDGKFLGFEVKFGSVEIAVGEVTPPTPPDPGPKPPVPPGPVTGLRVILAWDKSAKQDQIDMLYSPKVADYLNAKCKDGPKGWRLWDKDTVVHDSSPVFKGIWDAVKPNLAAGKTWVVIATDQKVEYFPLPATEAALLDLLRKYGG